MERMKIVACGQLQQLPLSCCPCGEKPCKAREKLESLKEEKNAIDAKIKKSEKALKKQDSRIGRAREFFLKRQSANLEKKIERRREFLKKKGWYTMELDMIRLHNRGGYIEEIFV